MLVGVPVTVLWFALACIKHPAPVAAPEPVSVRRPGPEIPAFPNERIAPATAVMSARAPRPPSLRDSAAAAVRKGSPSLRFCYESRLKTNPSLGGRVEVAWTVAKGAVTAASLRANTTGDAELARCVLGRVRTWTFEPGVSGDVQWPFVFKPAS